MCTLLGISIPLQPILTSCSNDDRDMMIDNGSDSGFSGKVLIIGAGPAGMTAGHILSQRGIDFQILEALPSHGGRIKTNNTFADFPIPLGAEWVHVDTNIFDEIVNDSDVNVDIQTTMYDPINDVAIDSATGTQVSLEDAGFTIDSKFINSSWFDFFQTYVYPNIQSRIIYNSPVTSIDYSSDTISVTTSGGQTFTADKVIVAVPLKILQNGIINFSPNLSSAKQQAIANANVWSGFKAFFEFSSTFWPTIVGYDIMPASVGQKMYYDASYGQNTSQNVLGLFSTGAPAETYIGINNDDDFRDFVLAELDALFNNQATANYVKHIRQNWNAEPYANGAYLSAYEDASLVNVLGESVDDKLYFAGDSYTTGDDWSSVHAAARSAIRAVGELAD